jgi:hypothetical protein
VLRLILHYFHNNFSSLRDFNKLCPFKQLPHLSFNTLVYLDEVAAVLASHDNLSRLLRNPAFRIAVLRNLLVTFCLLLKRFVLVNILLKLCYTVLHLVPLHNHLLLTPFSVLQH